MEKYKKIGLLAIMGLTSVTLNADGPNRDQWASMEYKQWKFSPKNYYYSWVYKKVLGITFKIPAAGIHDRGFGGVGFPGDNYVNERWRQMAGLRIKAVTMTEMEDKATLEIRKRWDEIMLRDALELADKAVDAGKLIEDSKRNKISSQITRTARELPPDESQNIMDEYERIRQNINIIHKAFIPNADKIVAYRKQLNKLERLNRITRAIYTLRQSEKVMHPEQYAQTNDDWFDLD